MKERFVTNKEFNIKNISFYNYNVERNNIIKLKEKIE